MCIKNQSGCALVHLFCLFLMYTPIGIKTNYLKTTDSSITDNMYILKKLNNDFCYYSTIMQDFPQLKA